MRRVVAIGPMPPPIHGMAFVHAETVAALARVTTVDVIAVMPGDRPRGLHYHLGKLARVLIAVPLLILARLRGASALYCAIDAGVGGYYSCLFVMAGRALGLDLFLHHHNYNYLVESTRPMRWLTAIAGSRARHIVLCARMAQDIRASYPRVQRTIVVPNDIVLPPSPHRTLHSGPFRIGLMSNLTPQKGVNEFLTIIDRLRDQGMSVTGTLAGPVSPPALADEIGRRSADPASGIDWLGRIDEAGKARFFAGIDAFVFPTHMESFGLVLLEALAHGVPIIAPGHGCICLFEGSPAATVIPVADDFVATACGHIRRLAAADQSALSAAAREQAVRLTGVAGERRHVLIAALIENRSDLEDVRS